MTVIGKNSFIIFIYIPKSHLHFSLCKYWIKLLKNETSSFKHMHKLSTYIIEVEETLFEWFSRKGRVHWTDLFLKFCRGLPGPAVFQINVLT